jgi:hypothetical protein
VNRSPSFIWKSYLGGQVISTCSDERCRPGDWKNTTTEEIANVLEIMPEEVEKAIKKKK